MSNIDTQLDTNALFTQYVNVVNRALGEHRDEMPYKQMIDLGQKLTDDKKIGVAVYKDDASSPHDWFTVTFDSGKLKIADHGKKDTDISWKTRESHLQEVVASPEKYVNSPLKLDLDWLKKRLSV